VGLLSFGRGAPVGLDIGSSTFRAVQLKPADDKPLLINYASVKTADGLVNEGEIVDVEGVSKVLASFWRENKISEKKVVIGVANQKVVVRVIEMPYMSEHELRSAIQYQINDYIPIPIEEAIIDFQIISEHENADGNKMMNVLVVAARKDMVENTIAAVKGAGLKPVVVDVSSLAFARAIMGNMPEKVLADEEDYGATALINISASLTDIVVIEDDIPKFTRISSFGGNVFTEALSEQLGVSIEFAEDLKARIGLPPVNGEAVELSEDQEVNQYINAVHSVLEQEMSRFIAEIRRSLDYYVVQATRVKRIDRVVVSGGGAKLKNFIEHLKHHLQMEVEVGRPLQNIQIKRKAQFADIEEDELSMAICLGLGMRGVDR
jgi:type IV pilus assembly protein PilM